MAGGSDPMKRARWFLAALIPVVLVSTVFGAEVKVCDMFVRPGTRGEVCVAVYDVLDMAGADIEVTFDPSLVEARSASKGELLSTSQDKFLMASNLDPCPEGETCPPPPPGLAKLSFASARGIAASFGIVATIGCEVSRSAPESASTVVGFQLARFYSSVPEPFEITPRAGTVYFTSKLAVGAATDKREYSAGETVRISAFAFNPFKSPRQVDFYFAILFGDGSLRFLPGLWTDYTRGRISFLLQSATSYPERPLFWLRASDDLPPGRYVLFAAMAEPGTLSLLADLWSVEFVVASGR